MASRNREKRQKRRRKKKMKASVRNGLIIAICVLLAGSYVGYETYMRVNTEDQFGEVEGTQDLQDDETFAVTNGTVSYTVYSVGQGEAILIQNKGTEALIDTGTKESAADLCKKLKNKIKGDLEYLVLTSPTEGRVGGLEEVCKNFAVKTAIVGEMGEQEKYVWRNLSTAGRVVNGDNLSYDVGEAATLFIIKPEVSSDDPLDRSLTTYFNFGTTGFFALSDAGKEEISRAFGSVTNMGVLTLSRNGLVDVNKVIPSNNYGYVNVSTANKEDSLYTDLSDIVKGSIYVTAVVGDLEYVSDGTNIELTDEDKKEDILDEIEDRKRDAEREAQKKARDEEKAAAEKEASGSEEADSDIALEGAPAE